MFRVLLGFVILGVILWLAIKLLRSPKFDKLYNDISKGKLDIPEFSKDKDTMKDITKKKDVLGKQVDINIKKAKKLENESENIKDFLDDRGDNKTEKEGGE